MPLKAPKEVKHLLVTAVFANLDEIINSYINDGWDILDTKILSFDQFTNNMTILYILGRKVKIID